VVVPAEQTLELMELWAEFLQLWLQIFSFLQLTQLQLLELAEL
jgi:hypothetical protein